MESTIINLIFRNYLFEYIYYLDIYLVYLSIQDLNKWVLCRVQQIFDESHWMMNTFYEDNYNKEVELSSSDEAVFVSMEDYDDEDEVISCPYQNKEKKKACMKTKNVNPYDETFVSFNSFLYIVGEVFMMLINIGFFYMTFLNNM